MAPPLDREHRRRLREVWRSAGWPCRDAVEIELLAGGWLERVVSASGHETVRVTDAGVQALAETLARHRAQRDAHEALVARLAEAMTRAGRLAWRGLALRAPVDGGWAIAKPDLFSIRHTTVEAYLEPVVHEVKVRRADLLADLKRPAKRAAYLALGGECWYVLRAGIAEPGEIPPECGVLVEAAPGGFEVARPAPRRPATLPFAVWMALAKSVPEPGWRDDESQSWLADAH